MTFLNVNAPGATPPPAVPPSTPPVDSPPTDPGTPPTPPATPPVPPVNAPDWKAMHETLPVELRDDPSIKTLTSFENLAKGYVHAQKSIGKEKYFVPDKHASKEDWGKVFNKLGNPEKAEDYKIKLPEGTDADMMKPILEAAHRNGVLPWQMEEVVNSFTEASTKILTERNTQDDLAYEKDMQALKKDFGDTFGQEMKKADMAFNEFLPDPAMRQQFVDAGLNENPLVLRMLSNASKLFSEDKLLGAGGGEFMVMSSKEALAKATAIQSDPNHAYRDKSHMNYAAAQKEVKDLFAVAFPE